MGDVVGVWVTGVNLPQESEFQIWMLPDSDSPDIEHAGANNWNFEWLHAIHVLPRYGV